MNANGEHRHPSNYLQPGVISTRNANAYTPLHYAAYNGHVEVCRLLLKANASIETNTCADQSPLSLAAQKGNPEVCRLLLEKGADTEAIDSSAWTPLHHAVNGGFLDTCRLLVESKAHIDGMRMYLGTRALSFFLRAHTMRYSDGKTPLQMARKLKHTEIVEFLKYRKEGGHLRKRRRMCLDPIRICSVPKDRAVRPFEFW